MNTQNKPKLKVAIYWGAACGGCCVSVLDVHEKVLDIVKAVDFVFWPIALDIKYKDVDAMPDKSIDVCLYNGAIRNSENEHIAKVLRKKSKVLVAYGSCAHLGGIPGLANLTTKEEIFRRAYEESESTVNPDKIRPTTETKMPEGTLTLPHMYNDVKTLAQTVQVDYFIPGCPPQTERLVEVLMLIIEGKPLPPAGSVVGALEKTLCDTCPRTKSDKKLVKEFKRPWQVLDDGITCLLEQGIICMGPSTRGGCGARCISGNYPCRGCYGPPTDSPDPGAAMMSAIGSMMDVEKDEDIKKIVEQVVDPAGTFYRFSVPGSILRRALK
ncbi:MAG: oxidoreductase [Bdellovibrionales bacterium RIFOXYD1_FULL_53_11]|nr:MAG: oxidoreductase [Bdellovibrionales bacterium RIFOXYD1_FULL_53_11]